MKQATIFTATVIKTGENVRVYSVKTGGFANYIDPKIIYKSDELKNVTPEKS